MTWLMNQHQKMHHKAARQFSMVDVTEATHPTPPRVEKHTTTQFVKISTVAATNRTASPSLSTIVMTVGQTLRDVAARRFAMGDVAEDLHPTLPRAATHATKISFETLTGEAATNSTASTSIPTIVMTECEQSRHKTARHFEFGDVTNDAPLPTLPRAEKVKPKKKNAPLNTRATLTDNAASDSAAVSATSALAATSTVADDDHDPFRRMTGKKVIY